MRLDLPTDWQTGLDSRLPMGWHSLTRSGLPRAKGLPTRSAKEKRFLKVTPTAMGKPTPKGWPKATETRSRREKATRKPTAIRSVKHSG